jgi:hypothetical protein
VKTNLKRAIALLLAIVGLAVLSGNKAFKLHANPQACSTTTLQGGYGAGTSGLINTSGNPNDIRIKTFAPFAEAAYFLFDGHGNLSGSSTVDFAGFISPVTFTGTYTVNANCTGSLTVDAGASGIVHRDLVIVDAGKEVEFVSTDPGVVIAGYMKKQRVGGE